MRAASSGGARRASSARARSASRPTTTIRPPDSATASTHSVASRRTRHGTPSHAASRWTPPESVRTAAAWSWSGERRPVAERARRRGRRARARRRPRRAPPRVPGWSASTTGRSGAATAPSRSAHARDRRRRRGSRRGGSWRRGSRPGASGRPEPGRRDRRQRGRIADLGGDPRREVLHHVADERDAVGRCPPRRGSRPRSASARTASARGGRRRPG